MAPKLAQALAVPGYDGPDKSDNGDCDARWWVQCQVVCHLVSVVARLPGSGEGAWKRDQWRRIVRVQRCVNRVKSVSFDRAAGLAVISVHRVAARAG